MRFGEWSLKTFDIRYLGFAFFLASLSIPRSFSNSFALYAGTQMSPYLCLLALLIGCLALVAWMSAAIRKGSAVGSRNLIFACTALYIASIALFAAGAWWASPLLPLEEVSLAAYFGLGVSSAGLFIVWLEVFSRQEPWAIMFYIGLSVLIKVLLWAAFWLVDMLPYMTSILAASLCISSIMQVLLVLSDRSAVQGGSSLGKNSRSAPSKPVVHLQSALMLLALSAFSKGALAVPQPKYYAEHRPDNDLIGAVAFLVVLAVAYLVFRGTKSKNDLRASLLWLFPLCMVLWACFSFARMLDSMGTLRYIISLSDAFANPATDALLVAVVVIESNSLQEIRKRGLSALVVAVCFFGFGLVAYILLGNYGLYVQVLLSLTFLLAFSYSIIRQHQNQLVLEGGLEERCHAIVQLYGLSKRESEVYLLLVRGYSSDMIASELVISPSTAQTHRKNIYAKLGIHSIEDLIRMTYMG